MKKIGYIISDRQVKNVSSFIDRVSFKEYILNKETYEPCIIIGYNKVKLLNLPNLNILDRKLSNNTFWTFSKTDKRDLYEKDINEFNKFCKVNALKNLKYKYINVLTINYTGIKFLLELLKLPFDKYVYIENGTVYLSGYRDYVFGLSLRILKYANYNVAKLINRIKTGNNVKFVDYKNHELNQIKTEITKEPIEMMYLMNKLV